MIALRINELVIYVSASVLVFYQYAMIMVRIPAYGRSMVTHMAELLCSLTRAMPFSYE